MSGEQTHALTIWQPWASLIMAGEKKFEFRKWEAPRRLVFARIVIHAGGRPAKAEDLERVFADPRRSAPGCVEENVRALIARHRAGDYLPRGVGLGMVTLGAPKRCSEIWKHPDVDPDMWAWPVSEPIYFPEPIPANGAQRFWKWAPEPDLFRAPRT